MPSYHRTCRKCGRRIQLRQMPGGQWVAFEGYEELHSCGRRPQPKARPVGPQQTERGGSAGPSYDDLGFADISIEGGPTALREGPAIGNRPAGSTKGDRQSSVIAALAEAERTRQVIQISYRSRRAVSTREIEPLGHDARYCYAYCRLRQDYRQFRLDAIESASPTTEIFLPRSLPPQFRTASWRAASRRGQAPASYAPPQDRSSTPASSRGRRVVAWVLGIGAVVWLLRACGG